MKHEAVFVPSNHRNKQTSINIYESHRSYARVKAWLLLNKASRPGVKLSVKLHACSCYSQSQGVRHPVKKEESIPAS